MVLTIQSHQFPFCVLPFMRTCEIYVDSLIKPFTILAELKYVIREMIYLSRRFCNNN